MSDEIELPDGIEITDAFISDIAKSKTDIDRLKPLVAAFKEAGVAVGDMEKMINEADKTIGVLSKLTNLKK